MKDYYQILGLAHTATFDDIKRAYRELVKKHHPDVNSTLDAEERTKELNAAWAVLSDPQAKITYDRTLKAPPEKPSAGSSEKQGAASQNKQNAPPPPKPDPKQKPSAASSKNQAANGRNEQNAPPPPKPDLKCKQCGRRDGSLRFTVIVRVYSFIVYSRKSSEAAVLCSRCRVRQSLVASAISMAFGWWSPWGFFWTLDALFDNDHGGEQPKEKNVTLLRALAFQLYQDGNSQAACEALEELLRLAPDAQGQSFRDYLKQQFRPAESMTFAERLIRWEANPAYYHSALLTAPLLIGFFVWGIGLSSQIAVNSGRNVGAPVMNAARQNNPSSPSHNMPTNTQYEGMELIPDGMERIDDVAVSNNLPIIVTVGDTEFEFAGGTSTDTIKRVLAKRFPKQVKRDVFDEVASENPFSDLVPSIQGKEQAMAQSNKISVAEFERVAAYEPISKRPSKAASDSISTARTAKTFAAPEKPLPLTGKCLQLSYEFATLAEGHNSAPLKIRTRASDGNYVVKVEDKSTGVMGTFFIRRGGTLETELPTGSYVLKFAMGDKWYGAEHLFGPSTVYSYISEKMYFTIEGDTARGHEIELIPQVGGNLKTPALRATDW